MKPLIVGPKINGSVGLDTCFSDKYKKIILIKIRSSWTMSADLFICGGDRNS